MAHLALLIDDSQFTSEQCPFMDFIAHKMEIVFSRRRDKLNFRFDKKKSTDTIAL